MRGPPPARPHCARRRNHLRAAAGAAAADPRRATRDRGPLDTWFPLQAPGIGQYELGAIRERRRLAAWLRRAPAPARWRDRRWMARCIDAPPGSAPRASCDRRFASSPRHRAAEATAPRGCGAAGSARGRGANTSGRVVAPQAPCRARPATDRGRVALAPPHPDDPGLTRRPDAGSLPCPASTAGVSIAARHHARADSFHHRPLSP